MPDYQISLHFLGTNAPTCSMVISVRRNLRSLLWSHELSTPLTSPLLLISTTGAINAYPEE